MSGVSARLRLVACGALLVGIVLAPWMYGCTRTWSILALCGLLTLAGVCWLGAGVIGRELSALPVQAGMVAFFLVAAGWLVVLTGPHLEADPFTIKHFTELSARWPASFIVKTPVQTMWLCSGLLGVLLLVADPATSVRWRRWMYSAMAVVGASVVLLGIVQVLWKAPAVLWDQKVPGTGYFFATFFEDSIGGSFVSLVWPLAGGELVARLSQPWAMTWKQWIGAAIWSVLLVVTLAGLPAMGSIFGMLNVVWLAGIFGLWVLWRLPLRNLGRIGLRGALVAALCGGTMAMMVVASGKLPAIKSRWSEWHVFQRAPVGDATAAGTPPKAEFRMRADGLIESAAVEPGGGGLFGGHREQVVRICLKMMPHAGLLGFGPGTWSQTYPHFTDDTLLRTFYLQMQFAHQDYLQAVVEWGLLGTAAWAVLFIGALRCGIYRLRRCRVRGGAIGAEEGMVAGAMAGLLGVLAHALFDFPLQVPSLQLYVAVLLGMLWAAGPVPMVKA